MEAATNTLKEAQINSLNKDGPTEEQVIDVENQWLERFINFFGDNNVAKVASHYLNQTIFGSLSAVCAQSGHTWVDVVETDIARQKDDARVQGNYTAELIEREGQQKCTIRADLVKFGSALMCQNFKNGAALTVTEPLSKTIEYDNFLPLVPPVDYNSSTPALINLIEVEFDVNEMRRLEFKPKILNAQIISNIQLDWEKMDQIIEENGKYE